ncbi:sensor histidine kinase [Clostridium tyrobutyricum]|uniref:Autolysis histidine kinase LytS n=1 Tax=Clostridium tyrobutyricum DIVETGP TaxID=1408889 RepID=W6NI90_CLOTY|nr:LytS/YhcK type 5TM receptor domain-containing protein [Clostridium tyrobutyricum]AND85886.1 signal transduction histidine kinase [Clostridium tyrobutyricum]ANP70399.1 hypothetical protein BA182_12170 [Clostridium tyrobutyricum]MBR9648223.1 histidine kinase [Clostridium tyrobutyricum]MBV4428542.1 histidine kinase [Clostridium tyrobutyricum]MBV4434627.1 histidine kinase [Clostridium tyrobutyricum]
MIYVQLLESMSLIALSAYVYNQIHLSKSLIKEDLKFTDKLILIVFFGVLGIIGNYTAVNVGTKNINHNIEFHDAIANTRPIAAIIAGYIGGPVVGVVVGLVAGVNRYFLGGFTALACAIATVAEGLIGSITRKISIDDDYNLKKVFTGAIIAEMVQMIVILIFSRPFYEAVNLVKLIALPMILINSFGTMIFINIIKNAKKQYRINELEKEAATAKFVALSAQIEPHFLFNALNTIASLCRTNPLKSRELIIDLSNYFRQTLIRKQDFTSLKNEIEFIKSYFSIEKARFGSRLTLIIDIPENFMEVKIPVFVLQPIIENAIKHGILPKVDGGIIILNACISKNNKDEMLFYIEDTGVGMDAIKLENILKDSSKGIGLKNVNQRLKLLYGENYGIDIKSLLGKGTKISFNIPVKGGILNEL